MTFQSFALDDIADLHESAQVEFKLAGGRDGQGQLPEDIWATYSSFANTLGGEIILGVREIRGHFTIEGIPNPLPVLQEFWEILDDPSRISHNILAISDVQLIQIMNKKLIRIHVPLAPEHLKPIFIGNDVYTGTYFRLGDADMHASRRQVSQLLRRARYCNKQLKAR
ncbi:helix-turn-helix domain-containing protein [Shewanella sp. KJ2020]|uniref:AlbA family DNA-binding domain-containing protein n=1 Tax=Shewanella sp. KJ2020 TaxID=2919172 RepID=UPI0020A78AB9|nr:ATP-binding protein [Shewanella sp. KJ2020]MCP3129574.1 ATP-binding protein [Shewanella sp. KJ2020]